jgi:phenylpropionate dioxygenase-like ring-hydroxylating dioxygenase large terminal subunit
VPAERYFSKAFHDLEVEKVWKRVWQMACHEDDIPEVGDSLPYDIAGLSFLVVRTAPDEIKAYYNACLHRGRKLKEARGKKATELRCEFHGWCWHLDGRLKEIPCEWDFAYLDKAKQNLPEARVGRWGRFVFINPDPSCQSLEDFVGDLSSHFSVLPYEKRYKEAHVAKIVRANWKTTMQAFMEAYHVITTHPQIITGHTQDANTKYDVFGNYSRAITVAGMRVRRA